mmetsp:Transcript_60435/g.141336  ORF Transcript_60435/g.141336 Transcript_60435/m.141336 type:complete len:282 (+) Transcript_60435:73-918(+)
MYIGPWQEYKLARLIQQQHQAIAREVAVDAVRPTGSRPSSHRGAEASPASSRSGFSGLSTHSAPAQLPGQPSAQVRLNDYCDSVERLSKANDRRRWAPPRPRLPSGSSTGSTRPYSSSSRGSDRGPGFGSGSSAGSAGYSAAKRTAGAKKASGKPPKAASFEEQRRSRILHMQRLYGLGQAEASPAPEVPVPKIVEPDPLPVRQGRDLACRELEASPSPVRREPSQPISPKSDEWTLPTVKEADPLSMSMGSSGGLIAWSKGLQPDALSPQASLASFFPAS